jgi:hypothetical protein
VAKKAVALVAVCGAALLAAAVASAANVMSYATDPATVTGTFPATELACGPFSSDGATVGQSYRPQDFGVSGPYRVSGISIGWSGAAHWTLTARNASGSVVMGPVSSTSVSATTPAATIAPFFADADAYTLIAPAGTSLDLSVELLNNSYYYTPPSLFGVNFGGNAAGAPQPTYSCGGPSTPLSTVTNAALPWSVALVPLSRADLASETLRQLATGTFPHWSPGEINALSQQALNGGLNDYINSITAKQKMAGTSLADYLTQYARLLLGTTNLGYPYLAGG